MQLTMTGEYAIRAMLGLSALPFGESVCISVLSADWDIPEDFLRKISARLTKAGLIVSQRGSQGGIRLAKPAEQLTLLDVIEAIEGKIFLNKCLIGPEVCYRSNWCAVHCIWGDAQDAMKRILTKRSLAEIVALNNAQRPISHSGRTRPLAAEIGLVKAS